MRRAKSIFQKYAEEDGSSREYAVEKMTLRVNQQLRKRMAELGLTQQDLAHRLGVSQPQIAKYLSYSSNLTLRTLASLANALESEWRELELLPRDSKRSSSNRRIKMVS